MIGQRKSQQKGNILLLTALSLTTLFLFTALAINSCTLVIAHNKLREAADAGALAAAQQLGMGKGEEAAKSAGMILIDKNLEQMADSSKKEITIANNTANVSITYAVPIFCGTLLNMPTYDLSAKAKASAIKTTVLSPRWSNPATPLVAFDIEGYSALRNLPQELMGVSHTKLYTMMGMPDLWIKCYEYVSKNGRNGLENVVEEWATTTKKGKSLYWGWDSYDHNNKKEVYKDFADFIYAQLNEADFSIDRSFSYCNVLYPGDTGKNKSANDSYLNNLTYGYQGVCTTNTELTYYYPATVDKYAIDKFKERLTNDKNTNVDNIKFGQARLYTYPIIKPLPKEVQKDFSLHIMGFAEFWLKDIQTGPALLLKKYSNKKDDDGEDKKKKDKKEKAHHHHHHHSDKNKDDDDNDDGNFYNYLFSNLSKDTSKDTYLYYPAFIAQGYFVKMSVPGANIQENDVPDTSNTNYGLSSVSLMP